MAMKTKIPWCNTTWNPIDGCTKVSPGCAHCYAERMAKRFWKGRPFTDVQFHPERILQPVHWKKPRMVFVGSMGDLFHEKVNSVYANAIWDIMQHQAPQHTYLVLTKRPDRMMKFLKWRHENQDNERRIRIAPNIWVGTTVEDRPNAETRLEYLLQCPAVLRFVSYEPALGTLIDPAHSDPEYLQLLSLIDWFICGSESGPGARWFNENWAREVKEFCVQAGKPFFFKQSRAGRKIIHLPELDGQIWDQTPAIGPHEGSWYIPGVICSPEGDPMTGKLYWKHSEPKIVNTQEMR